MEHKKSSEGWINVAFPKNVAAVLVQAVEVVPVVIAAVVAAVVEENRKG